MIDEPMDPFISYRESYDMSPELLSPNVSKNSDSSLPSLNSPSNSLGEDDHMPSFMNYSVDEDRSESSARPGSPYIPMNMDDLPLLLSSSNDLMWSNSSSPAPPSPTRKVTKESSSLAQLLSSDKKSCVASDLVGHSNSWNVRTNEKSTRTSNSSTNSNNKRTNSNSCSASKRVKIEPKEKLSSELLQQLISNNSSNGRGRPKKANWLLEGQKAACVSQPSDSVLMNLLGNISGSVVEKKVVIPQSSGSTLHRYLIRVNSKSLLNPETAPITSLLSLTDKDYEVNAPVNSSLLQGEDLIKALDICDSM
ncbi:hypothetical protein HHI36_000173 [Cryptolaemus montrouzieri]|uniref:HIF-1 alpha C-terminal transactivation domain-containing protein n=1 Tax=Cryptolaemus montrouzieri TaxID=559131 RepID=A0ABD2P4M9_9CUCU